MSSMDDGKGKPPPDRIFNALAVRQLNKEKGRRRILCDSAYVSNPLRRHQNVTALAPSVETPHSHGRGSRLLSSPASVEPQGPSVAADGLIKGLATTAGIMTVSAVVNHQLAKQAEQRNTPSGRFLDVHCVCLHYAERREGPPLVLLHGNGSMIENSTSSGLVDLAARQHRVPAPVPVKFKHFPREVAVRPSQISAEAAESALLIPAAAAVSDDYGTLKTPVVVVVGAKKRLVDPVAQSHQLHDAMAPWSHGIE